MLAQPCDGSPSDEDHNPLCSITRTVQAADAHSSADLCIRPEFSVIDVLKQIAKEYLAIVLTCHDYPEIAGEQKVVLRE